MKRASSTGLRVEVMVVSESIQFQISRYFQIWVHVDRNLQWLMESRS